MTFVYLLMEDSDGTLGSIPEPWGAAVETEDEAKRYIALGGTGYPRWYQRIKIYQTFEEAMHDAYHKGQKRAGCRYCGETKVEVNKSV